MKQITKSNVSFVSNFRLHFVTEDGVYHRYDLTWNIDHSLGKTENDLAYVANVDGNVVGFTPFRQTVIPPPLSAFELRFKHKVSQVKYSVGIWNPNSSEKGT